MTYTLFPVSLASLLSLSLCTTTCNNTSRIIGWYGLNLIPPGTNVPWTPQNPREDRRYRLRIARKIASVDHWSTSASDLRRSRNQGILGVSGTESPHFAAMQCAPQPCNIPSPFSFRNSEYPYHGPVSTPL